MNDSLLLLLSGLYAANSVFVFRFQRTTLGIVRMLERRDDHNMQAAMSAPWIGCLGWIHTVMMFGIPLLFLGEGRWAALLLFLIYTYGILPWVCSITPFPSYGLCFRLIEKELDSQIKKSFETANGPIDHLSLKRRVKEISKEVQLNLRQTVTANALGQVKESVSRK